jgi:cell wall-associated NlpC family hydrolase
MCSQMPRMKPPLVVPKLRDLSGTEGLKILQIAQTKVGVPYKPGVFDCSHSINKIYREAGYPYKYATSKGFEGNPQWRRVERPQPGDVVQWPNHVVMYAPGIAPNKDCIGAHGRKVPFGVCDITSGSKYHQATPAYWRLQLPK